MEGAPRLAKDLFGLLQFGIRGASREGVQPAASRAHPRTLAAAQPLLRFRGQRRADDPPGFVRLAMDQPAADGAVGDLTNMNAPSWRLAAQDLDRGIGGRHD